MLNRIISYPNHHKPKILKKIKLQPSHWIFLLVNRNIGSHYLKKWLLLGWKGSGGTIRYSGGRANPIGRISCGLSMNCASNATNLEFQLLQLVITSHSITRHQFLSLVLVFVMVSITKELCWCRWKMIALKKCMWIEARSTRCITPLLPYTMGSNRKSGPTKAFHQYSKLVSMMLLQYILEHWKTKERRSKSDNNGSTTWWLQS